MDLILIITIVAVVLLVMLVFGALHAQQSGQLRDIQMRLMKLGVEEEAKQKLPEALRRERAEILDPLTLLEAQLSQTKRDGLTDSELDQVSAARAGILDVTAQLMSSDEWIGPPYDLEWAEYLERLPRLKTLYMRQNLQPGPSAATTSGN